MNESLHTMAVAILAKMDSLAPAVEEVPALLRETKSAHLRYRQALSQSNGTAARLALADAANAGARAELLDSDHLDPAWHDSASTHSGHQISHEEIHGGLLGFYFAELSK